jgi:hydroxymethylbilane synthase
MRNSASIVVSVPKFSGGDWFSFTYVSTLKMSPVSQDTQSFEIGTRKSKLALSQTDLVVKALNNAWPEHQFNIRASDAAAGDLDKVTPFKDMPVKNLWTHDLEQHLIEEKLDLLVHALKGKPLASDVSSTS